MPGRRRHPVGDTALGGNGFELPLRLDTHPGEPGCVPRLPGLPLGRFEARPSSVLPGPVTFEGRRLRDLPLVRLPHPILPPFSRDLLHQRIAQRFETRVERIIKGARIVRNGSAANPAYLIEMIDGRIELYKGSVSLVR